MTIWTDLLCVVGGALCGSVATLLLISVFRVSGEVSEGERDDEDWDWDDEDGESAQSDGNGGTVV